MKTVRIPLVAALVAATAAAAPAAAQGPQAGCFGVAAKDKVGDQVSTAPGAAELGALPGSARENLDLVETFFTYESGEAAANFRIANLSKTIPPGATAISWYLRATFNGEEGWIRAMTDFSGLMAYDYGHFDPGPGVVFSEISVRDGEATGEIFEGANGVIKVVLPADAIGAPGTVIKPLTWFAYEARQILPAISPTPVKGGFLYEVDSAAAKHEYKVGAGCPAPLVAPPTLGGDGGTATAPGQVPVLQEEPLRVRVLTTRVRAKSVKRRLAIRLRAAAPITKLAAQLRKGRKVVAKGSLSRLSGTKTLKLKTRRLKRGTYVLDLAGTDSTGARRLTSARIRVR